MPTCNDCIHQELCNIYENAGVTDVPTDDITICEVFKNKADVVEVKHGYWVMNAPNPEAMKSFHEAGIGKAFTENSIYWTCSCCGKWGTPVHKYCSECGAKMDVKGD